MANRLNSLNPTLPFGFPQLQSMQTSSYGDHLYPDAPHPPQEPITAPMSIPEIRTEADLAFFNQFMISLGRDAIRTSYPAEPAPYLAHGSSFGSSDDTSRSGNSPVEDLFNPSELASLGLAGMPGIPQGYNHEPVPMTHDTSHGGLYPPLDKDLSNRIIAGLPRASANTTSPSVGQTPAYASNYPRVPNLTSNWQSMDASTNGHNYAAFDSLAQTRSPPPMATLAPRDYYKKTYRHVAPLGTAISSRSVESAERTDVDDDASETSEPEDMGSSSSSRLHTRFEEPTRRLSVQDLLLSDKQGDPNLKLPSIQRRSESDATGLLPGFKAIKTAPSSPPRYPHVPIKRHTAENPGADGIVRGVKRMELEDLSHTPSPLQSRRESRLPGLVDRHDRRRHAMLIRSWLLAVNVEWRRMRLRDLEREMEDEERMSEGMDQGDELDESDEEVEPVEEMPTPKGGHRLGIDDLSA